MDKQMKKILQKLVLTSQMTVMIAIGSVAAKAEEPTDAPVQQAEAAKPEKSVPVYRVIGKGCKVEAEQMLISDCQVLEDPGASGKSSIRFTAKESSASFTVKFPAGTYEGLAREKAKDNAHSTLNVKAQSSAKTENHKLYPSNPPLGIWELTTRNPIYLELEEECEITFTLNAGNSFGMELDYIQFVKIK